MSSSDLMGKSTHVRAENKRPQPFYSPGPPQRPPTFYVETLHVEKRRARRNPATGGATPLNRADPRVYSQPGPPSDCRRIRSFDRLSSISLCEASFAHAYFLGGQK